jgi:hypothetical protein
LLRAATAAIPGDDITFPVAGSPHVRRERVYCGELYHQMRAIWPEQLTRYRLSDEPAKDGHPFIGGGLTPDLIVHVPGSMESNVAVIEVKRLPAPASGVRKDVRTLQRFFDEGRYFGGILLFFGDSVPAFESAAGVAQQLLGRATRPVLILHHASPGEPCSVELRVSGDVLNTSS